VGLFVAETTCVLSPVFSLLYLRYVYAFFVTSALVIPPLSALILLFRARAVEKPQAEVQASTELMKKGIWVALAFNLIMLILVVWVSRTIGHFPDCGSYTPDSCDIPRNAVAGQILVSLLVIWALVMSLITLIAVLTVKRTTYRISSPQG
jgi:cytochrome bd-type quinol oxidase subunit 1